MKISKRYRNPHSCAVERGIQSTDSISFQGLRAHICLDILLVVSAQLCDYTIISSPQSVKNEEFRNDIEIPTAVLSKRSSRAQTLLVFRAHEPIYVKIYYSS